MVALFLASANSQMASGATIRKESSVKFINMCHFPFLWPTTLSLHYRIFDFNPVSSSTTLLYLHLWPLQCVDDPDSFALVSFLSPMGVTEGSILTEAGDFLLGWWQGRGVERYHRPRGKNLHYREVALVGICRFHIFELTPPPSLAAVKQVSVAQYVKCVLLSM